MTVFQEGDSYIHFTKYGGINRGIVKQIGFVTHIRIKKNQLTELYKSYHIINDKNISLELDGTDGQIYKLENYESTEPAA